MGSRCVGSTVRVLLGLGFTVCLTFAQEAPSGEDVIELGRRRELFVDDYLIERLGGGASLELHHPVAREVAVVHDAPWEGNTCGYHTVFQDGGLYRMYYRGSHHPPAADKVKASHDQLTCYAESDDGIVWRKPDLGLFEFLGSKENNIVWMGPGTHNFAPFRDTNPDCPPEARYKALGSGGGGLLAFVSPDGIHWSLMQEKPVITKGAFDSQNLAFWDSVRGCYVEYHRGFTQGVRAIMTSTSRDFREWSDPVWLEYPEGTPAEHLYTNQITPYFRAPHIRMGFPKRFSPSRRAPGNRMPGLSDGVFMTSRDGLLFTRWLEAFIRPGLQRERWVNRNNMTAWGIVRTASAIAGIPDELSVYSTEGYYRGDSCQIRRFTLRLDGFVSLQAPMSGGEVLTKPLRFSPPEEGAAAVPAPAEAVGAARIAIRDPIRGKGSLVVTQPAFFAIPDTQDLGSEVTIAVEVRGVSPGHRRLFSAYNGGPIRTGGRELIFDFVVNSAFGNGVSLRFNYDDVKVFVKREALTDWGAVSAGERSVHFAATWNDGEIRVYMDGKLVGEGGQPGYGPLKLGLGNLHFGEDHKGTSRENEPFLGMADDIVVVRRVLGPREIEKMAAEGAAAVLDPAVDRGAWYPMEGSSGGVLTDRLTADGAADAGLPRGNVPEPGVCQLLLNYSTSAAGSIRCELLTAEGEVIPGFGMTDCDELYGDAIEGPLSWRGITELKDLAGRPIRLRLELKDADVFALRFGRGAGE